MNCCNKEIKINIGKDNNKNLYWAKCEICGKQYKNADKNIGDGLKKLCEL